MVWWGQTNKHEHLDADYLLAGVALIEGGLKAYVLREGQLANTGSLQDFTTKVIN